MQGGGNAKYMKSDNVAFLLASTTNKAHEHAVEENVAKKLICKQLLEFSAGPLGVCVIATAYLQAVDVQERELQELHTRTSLPLIKTAGNVS